MGTSPPGWYNDDADNRMWWWDGSEWSDPAHDPRLLPGTPTLVDSATLQFVADPSWPKPPAGWFPGPMWEPEPGWPGPIDDLWRATGIDEEQLLADLSDVYEILSGEYEKTENLWRLDSRDDIPVVWVSPPNWPKPAPGWSPPAGWKAPREWGRAPKVWHFWQQDPSIIAFRTAAIHDHADRRSRSLVRTTIGIATLLTHGETMVCDIARLTPLALSPLPSAARSGFPVGAPPHLAGALRSAHYELNRTVSNLRTYLLRIAYGLGQPDEWLWQMRRAVVDARAAYSYAAVNAAEGVLTATVEQIRGEVARLNPRHAHRIDQLRAVLREIAEDIETRTKALATPQGSGGTSYTRTSRAVADWELAEDLAAAHLRALGFLDANRTPVGADGGFDVDGRGVVAQVKYRTAAVGRPDVQRLVGANRHGALAVFYSRAGYTQGAIDFAKHAGVALFQVDAGTSDISPVNESARALSRVSS